MQHLLSLDTTSLTATLQAGILGPELEAILNKQGYTLGHFPDSFQFSTLGGWLATRSAGMQSDKYGKIEDIVIAMKIVTPAGVLETPNVPKAAARYRIITPSAMNICRGLSVMQAKWPCILTKA